MPIILDRPRDSGRLTDPDWRPANTTTPLPGAAMLCARMPRRREIRVPFASGEFVVPIAAEPPDWLMPTLQALGGLFELSSGWDTYGSPAIEPSAVPIVQSWITG
jgi:hypothetical protein